MKKRIVAVGIVLAILLGVGLVAVSAGPEYDLFIPAVQRLDDGRAQQALEAGEPLPWYTPAPFCDDTNGGIWVELPGMPGGGWACPGYVVPPTTTPPGPLPTPTPWVYPAPVQ
jgi:hypothetical protein